MSNFEVLVQKIFISEHPNADALEIGHIGDPEGNQVVCRKGLYKTGDLIVYIGENSVVPEWVLKKYGFWNEEKDKGLLAGTKGDRVKAVKLRDAFSLGICIPVVLMDDVPGTNNAYAISGEDGEVCIVEEGQDVAEILGVTKYEPPIPVHMSGEVFNAGQDVGVNYDIEDLAKYPHVLIEDEEVQMTVKLHGTNCSVTCVVGDGLNRDNISEWTEVGAGAIAVGSKGLSAQGLFFKNNEANAGNLYLNGTRQYWEAITNYALVMGTDGNFECITVVGEVFGGAVQTGFDYGLKAPEFRVFDVYIGYRGRGFWLDDKVLDNFCNLTGITRVPLVYRGPYSRELARKLANDPESALPNVKHVREGVVIKPVVERRDPVLGRVVVKTRSDAYMTRKGNHTDYN
jgi:RNA ligase (TIGR02306 family)